MVLRVFASCCCCFTKVAALRGTPPGIGVRLPANDKTFSALIDNANHTASPRVRRLRNFVRINPVARRGRTILCRTDQAELFRRVHSLCHFDLTAANKFVTAATKTSVVE